MRFLGSPLPWLWFWARTLGRKTRRSIKRPRTPSRTKPPRFRKTSEPATAGRLRAVRSVATLAIPSLAILAIPFVAIRVRRLVAESLAAITVAVADTIPAASAVAVAVALVASRIRTARRVIRAAVRRVTRAAATRAVGGVRDAAAASAVAVGVAPLAFRILTAGTAAGARIPLAAPIAVGIPITLGTLRSVAAAGAIDANRRSDCGRDRYGRALI